MRTIFLTSFTFLLFVSNAQFKTQRSIATLDEGILLEASGIEESHENPGYLWSHNDSGGKAAIYLLQKNGEVKGKLVLQGIKNRDWEDIVTVREGGESYLYIAEIGDNMAQYDHVKLIKVKEPKLSRDETRVIQREEIEVMTFVYKEGPRDAEAIFYDHVLKEFVLITKRERKSMVYSFPFEPGGNVKTIASLGEVSRRNFTAADMNEQGEILLKNYGSIYFFGKSDAPAAKRILDWNPVRIDYTPEPQGEAICWMDGGFYTLSEKNRGLKQELLFFERED